ncbi:MAG: ferredoxin--NADP reductase [Acidimicrobiia bacterium]
MGQLIEVVVTLVGETALFDLDRTLTGQDGFSFPGPPDNTESPPELLAQRLFAIDEQIENIHVLSNLVTVTRTGGWDDEALTATTDVLSKLLVFYEIESPEDRIARLRNDYYNATVTDIRAHSPDLWVIKVTPDEPIKPFKPGQYTTLGLGFWEPRADEAMEDFEDDQEQIEKMARRSYSVASSIVGGDGNLVEAHPADVEFYVVQVRPDEKEIPALTPRIFTRLVGDRIYMGRKFTGRYTLDGVQPTDNLVLLATGTGEAPHNAMTAELLRNGHQGKIVSVVCVRYRRDLAYRSQHATVENRHPNYRHVALTTREPENEGNKLYIQDLITSGRLEDELGAPLDPVHTHAFLCGNPAMIGLPKQSDDGSLQFPERVGVSELLHEKGFIIDRPRQRGNVHYEEYWRDH